MNNIHLQFDMMIFYSKRGKRRFNAFFANTMEFERISNIFEFARSSGKFFISSLYKSTHRIQNNERKPLIMSVFQLQRFERITNITILNEDITLRTMKGGDLTLFTQIRWNLNVFQSFSILHAYLGNFISRVRQN